MATCGEELAALLEFGREQLGVEFKGAGSRTDKAFLSKVVRAVLGMANRQDGGRVIVGVEENLTTREIIPTGLSAAELKTWTQDDLGNSLATYADPYVTFDLEQVVHERKNFIVINVSEFEEVPILCKRSYQDTLKDGACYVRSRRKPETVEVSSHTDMRELLELAINKGVRRFLARAQQVGVFPLQPAQPTDMERYDEQLGELK